MKYWWVSQKGTFKHEFNGGYLWSPKEGKRGPLKAYENMRLINVGDPILSYANGHIIAISRAITGAFSAPKPAEFGNVGSIWSDEGWQVDSEYELLKEKISPKQNIQEIRHLLPKKHSPIQNNGDGNQAYLFEISKELFDTLLNLGDHDYLYEESYKYMALENANEVEWVSGLITDEKERETIATNIVAARKGQGLFKSRVSFVEQACRVTGARGQKYLIASHIKPWSKSNNIEKLDGHNGLLLSPHIDRLFDRGLLSFADNGDLLISKHCDQSILKAWQIKEDNTGPFKNEQKRYLDYHRKYIYKG
jgi:putative restriction endonuclease